jgi:hypothetical protein
MPVWIIQDEPIEIGEQIKDRNPPCWVVEKKLAVSPSILITNYGARQFNETHPEAKPLSLLPEKFRWYMRLTGAQLQI